jgi:hypothetical protein
LISLGLYINKLLGALVGLFSFYCLAYIPQQGVFELDSITQQKATGAAKEGIRASQGGLYQS